MVYRVASLLLSVFIVGCQEKSTSTNAVMGTVTLDGKPLPEGEIYFVLPGQVPTIIPIKDGHFEGVAKPGTHRIEICAYRPRTKTDPMPEQRMTPPPENYLPEKYNSKSEFTALVEAAGSKPFTFEMQSK